MSNSPKPFLIDFIIDNISYDFTSLNLDDYDIHAVDSNQKNALLFIINYYQQFNNNFSSTQINYLIEHSDILYKDKYNNDLLLSMLNNFRYINTHCNKNVWDYVLRHSDLKNSNKTTGFDALTTYFNKLLFKEDIFNAEQIDFLIEHSNFFNNHYERNPLVLCIKFAQTNSSCITNHIWGKLTRLVMAEKNLDSDFLYYLTDTVMTLEEENCKNISYVWPHIEDKNWFVDYLLLDYEIFPNLLNCPEIEAYIEKRQIQKSVVDTTEAGTKINKL